MFVERHYATRFTATILVAGVWAATRLSISTTDDVEILAARFSFELIPLPVVEHLPMKGVREVHVDYRRISAWISSVGAAVALTDVDGDGLANDLCHIDPRTDTVSVEPVPGTGDRFRAHVLVPSTNWDPATMAPMGCVPGDFNEDGHTDLLVYYWGRTPVLFLQQREDYPGFEARDLTSMERWFSNAATTADFDGDGHIDVVVTNYFPDGGEVLDTLSAAPQTMQDSMSRAFNGGSTRWFLWRAAGQFVEVDAGLDERVAHAWTLAVGAADLDGDLLPEVYFANDFGPDRLLHNRSKPGHIRFELAEGREPVDVPSSKVLGRDSFKGMGIDFGDVNGDGMLDMYVSNICDEYALLESHYLWINTGHPELLSRGRAPFVDRSMEFGVACSGWGWDAKLADMNNDGVPEALQATGFLKGEINRWPELQELATGNDELLRRTWVWPRFQPGDALSGDNPNAFFVQGPSGRYHDVATSLGLDAPQVTRGIAVADIEGDGDLDFVIANQWEPSWLARNDCPNCGMFLGLHLQIPIERGPTVAHPGHPQAGHGRPAIGATARLVRPDGRVMVAQVDGGNGHSGVRSPDLHFGLGDGSEIVEVEFHWRDGDGHVHEQALEFSPGWHTVRLGWTSGIVGAD